MHSFTPDYLQHRFIISPDAARLLGLIREFKGKQAMYAERKPEVLESLRQVAFIESVESSNRLERIQTDRKSLQDIVARRKDPSNRSQTELAGYRDVLELIHQNHGDMPFTVAMIRQLHRDLFQYTVSPGGDFKRMPNDIIEKDSEGNTLRVRSKTVPPYLVEDAMQRLHEGYDRALQNFDPLLLIPCYAHDFLAIHPFADGNGRMARLLTVFLLYRHGFDVARYISIEKRIEASKESYYESLNQSDQGWHNSRHDHIPFTEYLLGVVVAAYRSLDERVDELGTSQGYKTQLVTRVIEGLPQFFSIADIEERCLSVSRDTIKNVLQAQKKAGTVRPTGKGRGARWERLG